MKLQFLCANHRSQLENNVTKAIQFWQSEFDTGQFYLDPMLWHDAVPHLGCAFETAEILLSNKMIESEVACQWFSQSSILLASTFNNLRYSSEAEEINWMAINRLEKELAQNGYKNQWIKSYLQEQYLNLDKLLTSTEGSSQSPAKLEALGLIH
ncbi:hypothetical protein N9399_00085 [Porticoccaceae bacterium]|nr:hypothetical protein [Porticoccaceae bacterium]MDB3966140.1 hypothetical protein [Porticoccaceae bacterium]